MLKEQSKKNIDNCIQYATESGEKRIILLNTYYSNRYSLIFIDLTDVMAPVLFYNEYNKLKTARRHAQHHKKYSTAPVEIQEIKKEW